MKFLNQKGQGALEYLLIIGGALVIAAVVVTVLSSSGIPARDKPRLVAKLLFAQANPILFHQMTMPVVSPFSLVMGANGMPQKNYVSFESMY